MAIAEQTIGSVLIFQIIWLLRSTAKIFKICFKRYNLLKDKEYIQSLTSKVYIYQIFLYFVVANK